MALTGPAGGAPVVAPGPLASAAREAVQALRLLAGERWRGGALDGPALLGERAAILGLRRRGTKSPGGSCRLLRAADGWIALNLARVDDRTLLPAWLARDQAPAEDRAEVSAEAAPAPARLPPDAVPADVWALVARCVATRRATALVERARLLGLPAAVAVAPRAPTPPWHRVVARGTPVPRAPDAVPIVVDLSSLWAGPLATHLLMLAGARVIKVESARRPDGTRRGPVAFHDLLNAGKESVALDLTTTEGRARLLWLIERADVVVESARPRALRQLGIDAERVIARVPGLTWVSITGYGREEPEARWVAFGDDAAVAAGLAVAAGQAAAARGATRPARRTSGDTGVDDAAGSAVAFGPAPTPLFCGDAIADPLTGLHAAVAAQASWAAGGGRLVALALCDVAAHVLGLGQVPGPPRVTVRRVAGRRPLGALGADDDAWEVVADGERQAVRRPRARAPRGRARPLGADTETVLRTLAERSRSAC